MDLEGKKPHPCSVGVIGLSGWKDDRDCPVTRGEEGRFAGRSRPGPCLPLEGDPYSASVAADKFDGYRLALEALEY